MAATDLERLIVSLEASTVKYERALQRANAQTNTTMQRIERRTAQAAKGFADSFQKAYFAIGGLASARAAQSLIDSSIKIKNSLKIVGLEGDQLNSVYQRLFASAQRNAAPLEALATLYGRVAQVQGELGVSTEELSKFTDNIAVALRVSGRTAEESKGALLQLGQALGGTVVRAEEFNSINEGAVPILQSVAKGLVEAGGSVSKLRALVIEGKVSSKAFFDAFMAGAVDLQDKVGNAEMTISQGFTRFQNVLIDVAGKMNENTRGAKVLNEGLTELSTTVASVGTFIVDDLVPGLASLFSLISQNLGLLSQFVDKMSDMSIADQQFGFDVATAANNLAASMGLTGDIFNASSRLGGKIVEQNFKLVAADSETQAALDIFLGRQSPTVTGKGQGHRGHGAGASAPGVEKITPVSLKDYPITGDGKEKKAKKDDAKEMIADLEHELKLVGLTALEQEKLNNVRKAGAKATEEQKAQVEALTEQLYNEQLAVQYMKDLYDMLGDAAKTAITDIIGAMEDGKITAEEFGDVLSNVLNMAANFFLNQAFGGGPNGFSSIMAGIFGSGVPGRANGGPVKKGMVYKVNEHTARSELFAPTQDGVIIPRMPSGSTGAGGPSNVFHIDARGAQLGVGDEIRRALENYDRFKLPSRVNQIQKDPLARG